MVFYLLGVSAFNKIVENDFGLTIKLMRNEKNGTLRNHFSLEILFSYLKMFHANIPLIWHEWTSFSWKLGFFFSGTPAKGLGTQESPYKWEEWGIPTDQPLIN